MNDPYEVDIPAEEENQEPLSLHQHRQKIIRLKKKQVQQLNSDFTHIIVPDVNWTVETLKQ